jgi:hypothetical protein
VSQKVLTGCETHPVRNNKKGPSGCAVLAHPHVNEKRVKVKTVNRTVSLYPKNREREKCAMEE